MQSIKIYSNKEISELAEWYQSHIDNLPDSFQQDEAISYPHLKETVRIIIEQLPNLEWYISISNYAKNSLNKVINNSFIY